MNCQACGEAVSTNFHYCPKCGVSLTPTPNPTPTPPSPPHTKRQMPFWLKTLLTLAFIALVAVTAGILFTENLVDVVDNQLKVLHEGNVELAYDKYTSSAFKKSTSLEQFSSFLRAHPVFQSGPTTHFADRSISGKGVVMRGYLTSPARWNTNVEYRLIKEEGNWRIFSIRLLPEKSINQKQKKERYQTLVNLITEQLKALQKGQIAEVYQTSLSSTFQKSTSLEDFQKFIESHPILMHYDTLSFHKPFVGDQIATMAVIVHSSSEAAYLKYYFVYEQGEWKVLSMRLLSTEDGADADPSDL